MRHLWTILLPVLASSAASAVPPRPPMPVARPADTRPTVPTTRPAGLDLSTPQAPARAYAVCAVGGADPTTVRRVGTGDEPALQQAAATAAQAAAAYDLAAAVAARFGPDAQQYEFFARDRAADWARWTSRLAAARVNVEGNSALLFDPDGSWRLALRKDAGGWKVELPPALSEKDQHASTLRWMAANTAMIRSLAAEVRAARYPTAEAVEMARRARTAQVKAELLRPRGSRQ